VMGGIAEIRGGHCGDLGWSLRGFGIGTGALSLLGFGFFVVYGVFYVF